MSKVNYFIPRAYKGNFVSWSTGKREGEDEGMKVTGPARYALGQGRKPDSR